MKKTLDKKTIFYMLRDLNKALNLLVEMDIVEGQEHINFLIEKYTIEGSDDPISYTGFLLSEIDEDYLYLTNLFNEIYND